MLKPIYRLKKRRDFSYIYRRGRSRATRNIALSYIKTRKADELLIGFSASKKVGNAVIRNRVKRLMRESARLRMDKFPNGYRIIFNARAAAASASYQRISRDVDYLITKIV